MLDTGEVIKVTYYTILYRGKFCGDLGMEFYKRFDTAQKAEEALDHLVLQGYIHRAAAQKGAR